MKAHLLKNTDKFVLTVENIANELSIAKASAKVTAVRYVRAGILIRLKRDLYIPSDTFRNLRETGLFRIANMLHVPSYVSLTSALSFHGISTQQLPHRIESVTTKRAYSRSVGMMEFAFSAVRADLYSGFELRDSFFIATPEKALFDAVYLSALGKYQCSFRDIDFRKVQRKTLDGYVHRTNSRVQQFWKTLCETYKI